MLGYTDVKEDYRNWPLHMMYRSHIPTLKKSFKMAGTLEFHLQECRDLLQVVSANILSRGNGTGFHAIKVQTLSAKQFTRRAHCCLILTTLQT